MKAPLFAFALLLMTFGGHAQEAAASSPLEQAEKEFSEVDRQLNVLYNEMLGEIKKDEARTNFIAAERSWIDCRDKEAEFRTSLFLRGGIAYACTLRVELTKLTKERVEQIKKLQDDLESR